MKKIDRIRSNINKYFKEKKEQREESYKRFNSKWDKYYQSKYWKKLRSEYIAEHPVCENCLKYGRVVPAEEIHHKKPFGLGETEREKWQLLLDKSNLIALCSSCHDEFHRQLRANCSTYIKDVKPVFVQIQEVNEETTSTTKEHLQK